MFFLLAKKKQILDMVSIETKSKQKQGFYKIAKCINKKIFFGEKYRVILLSI